MGDQFPVVIQLDASHPPGAGAAEQTFHHAQSRDADGRGNQPVDAAQADISQGKPLIQQKRAGNRAYLGYLQIQSDTGPCGQHDGDQRGGNHAVPLGRKQNHKQRHKQTDNDRNPIGRKALGEIAGQLFHRRAARRGDAEEIIDLPQSDDDRDARGEAGDHRHGDKGRQPAQLKNAGDYQQDAGHQRGLKHPVHAVLGGHRGQDGGHGPSGAGNLVKSAAQQGDETARHNGCQQAGGRRGPAADAESQGQRQSHCRHCQPRHQVGDQPLGVIPSKFASQIFHIFSNHNASPLPAPGRVNQGIA